MKKRTPLEIAANDFDLQLDRLLRRAQASAGCYHAEANRQWSKVAGYLRSARGTVRPMMHADDIKATR